MPYENYRKIFRISQKNVERELGGVQTMSNELLARATDDTLSPDDALKSIDNMIGKVENLKRKVNSVFYQTECGLRLEIHSCPTCTKRLASQPKMSCVNDCTIWPQWKRCTAQTNRSSQDGRIPDWIDGLWTGV